MRIVRPVVLLAALLGLSGCMPLFLHAGYTAKDLVAVDRLAGTWSQPGTGGGSLSGNDTLTFRPESDTSWRVVFRGGGQDPESLVFLGHTFRAGVATLVDLEPHPSNTVSAFYVPAHVFSRVSFIGDTLIWGALDVDWAVAASRRGAIDCPVDTVAAGGDKNLVFTCGTPAVRRLLVAAAANPKAFSNETMVRIAP
jgi:hypothetical protein